MLKAIEKAIYVLLSMITVVLVFPGFVTVMTFAVFVVGHTFFGMTAETIQPMVDFVNDVWHAYGII